MSIEEPISRYIDQGLFVLSNLDRFKDRGHDPVGPFCVRVHRLFHWREDLHPRTPTCLEAVVEEPGHPLEGFWFVAYDRSIRRPCDFAKKWSGFNMAACPEEPIRFALSERVSWPQWHLRGEPQRWGHGFIFESEDMAQDQIEDFLPQIQQWRQRRGNAAA